MPTNDILIFGGGPAGMAKAVELAAAGKATTVIEKAEQVGGMAKTLVVQTQQGTYRADISPRPLTRARFFANGKYFPLPLRATAAVKQLGFAKGLRALLDTALAGVRRGSATSLHDALVAQYGRTLAEHIVIPYAEKLYGVPSTEVRSETAQWLGLELLQNVQYPEYGSGTLYETMADNVRAHGGKILLRSEPTVLRHFNGQIVKVDVRTPDGVVQWSPEQVLSSLPAPQLVRLFDPLPPQEVLDAVNALKFRSQVCLLLTIDRPHVLEDNCLYVADKTIPFSRVSEPRNFSPHMSPDGKTSLLVEYFCTENDDTWRVSLDRLFDVTMTHLEKLGIAHRVEVTGAHHIRQSYAFPVHDMQYAERLSTVAQWLLRFRNFYTIE